MTSTLAQTVPVIDVIPRTPDTQTLRLGHYFPYKPGQSVQVCFPEDPKKRYYSLSSSPTEKGHLDVTVKAERDTHLFASLFRIKIGHSIALSGPFGSFALPENPQGPFYFLAGGSGITPFRSMAKYILDSDIPGDIWIFNSARTPDDLIFREELLGWSDAQPRFHYVPTFTRSEEAVNGGETGRIEEKMLKKHLSLMEGTFYLCGPQGFCNGMEHLLNQTLHIPAARIRREQW